jgi:hypothetical protein
MNLFTYKLPGDQKKIRKNSTESKRRKEKQTAQARHEKGKKKSGRNMVNKDGVAGVDAAAVR